MPLIINFITTHWRVFGALFIILGVGIYERHAGYMEMLEIHKDYVVAQEKLVEDAKEAKLKKEQEDAKHTQDIIAGYDASVLTLAQRLRDIQTVPRGASVQVASPSQSASAVPAASNPSGRVDATLALKSGSAFSVDAGDALRDTLQCEKLMEWERSVQ